MKKLSLLFVLFVFLAGCQSANTSSNETEVIAETESYTVKDDRGKEISFDQVPETIVSLQPSNTEILFELGVGDKVVGVTEFDNYPEEATKIERVSDSVVFNTERIIELDPDVVIAYTIGEENALVPLEEAGIPVFVIQSASSFEDVYGDIEQIADVMKVEETGDKLVADIQSQIEEVQEKWSNIDQQKQVYIEISAAPDIYTTGKNTFQQEILNHSGVENLFGDQEGWLKVSEEEIIKRNPEIIITTVDYSDDPIAQITGRKGWEQLKAIKEDRVIQLDGDILSRPGPRIGEAVRLVAESVYPELF